MAVGVGVAMLVAGSVPAGAAVGVLVGVAVAPGTAVLVGAVVGVGKEAGTTSGTRRTVDIDPVVHADAGSPGRTFRINTPSICLLLP